MNVMDENIIERVAVAILDTMDLTDGLDIEAATAYARAAMRVIAHEIIVCRDFQKGKCCDNCRCVALADAVAILSSDGQ